MSDNPIQRWFYFVRTAVEASEGCLGDLGSGRPSLQSYTEKANVLLEALWQRLLSFHAIAKSSAAPVRIDWKDPPLQSQIDWVRKGNLKKHPSHPGWYLPVRDDQRSLHLLRLYLRQLEKAIAAVPLPPHLHRSTSALAGDLARYAQSVGVVESRAGKKLSS